jgi:diguanylate cyclase (GGDEF)-like protein
MNNLFIGLTLLIGSALLYAVYHIGQSIGLSRKQEKDDKEQHATYLKEILARDKQLLDLRGRIDDLNRLNDRYLSFLVKIPTVVQRLNATLKVEEIVSAVVDLVTEMISTKTVQVYLLDGTDNFLKAASSSNTENGQDLYAMGEGMVGMAAQHRMVQMREHFNKMNKSKGEMQQPESHLWIAVPVQFKDRLLGVIGIGSVSSPVGNETDLLKMIADIAGVALINQTMLGEAKHKANTDALTGLNNRNYLFHMAQNFVEKSIREGSPISIFLFDIDNFKHYNDTNGHDEGDTLLKQLSDVVRTITRKNSVIVRYGGEEFIVMLPGISKEDAFIYAERLREKIAEYPFRHRETQPLGRVSISGGVASFPIDGDSIYKVIQLADMSLYKAKSEGRNRVILHQSLLFSESEPDKMQSLTVSS